MGNASLPLGGWTLMVKKHELKQEETIKFWRYGYFMKDNQLPLCDAFCLSSLSK